MRIFIILLLCSYAVSKEVCTKEEIATRTSKCHLLFDEFYSVLKTGDVKILCESEAVERVIVCLDYAVKDCKENAWVRQNLDTMGMGHLKEILKNLCPKKSPCGKRDFEKCTARVHGPLNNLLSPSDETPFDANAFMNELCSFKECLPGFKGCSGYVGRMTGLAREGMEFVCDGERRQVINNLETCINGGPWIDYTSCFMQLPEDSDPCSELSRFKVGLDRCATTHLLNSPVCGENANNDVAKITTKVVELLPAMCEVMNIDLEKRIRFQHTAHIAEKVQSYLPCLIIIHPIIPMKMCFTELTGWCKTIYHCLISNSL